jgi:hypothetical protein
MPMQSGSNCVPIKVLTSLGTFTLRVVFPVIAGRRIPNSKGAAIAELPAKTSIKLTEEGMFPWAKLVSGGP